MRLIATPNQTYKLNTKTVINKKWLTIKPPRWFVIYTPIGPNNPDWAFVTKRNKKLYLVRETKSTLDPDKRRKEENDKIACGKSYFKTLGMDCAVRTEPLSTDDFK